MLQYSGELENRDIMQPRIHRFFPFLANFTFIMYLFFSFYGTGLPFREKLQDVSDIATSNIVNQIAFTTLFFTAIIAMLPKLKTVMGIIMKEKIFTIFIIFALISILWSDYTFISFKRWFQYFTAYLVALSVMAHVDFSEVLLKRIRFLFYIYLIASMVSILIIPGAKDFYGIWRGIAPSKNHLGQGSLLGGLVIFYTIVTSRGTKRITATLMFVLALILMVGSESMTTLSTFLFICFLGTVFYLDKYFSKLSIGRFISAFIIFCGAAFFLTVLFLAPDLLAALAGSAGRDLSFTGRTDLWSDILTGFSNHWLLGVGFQGFWIVENPTLLALYEIYVWLPNQAHNGYVDILNEVGVVGFILFLLIIFNYFRGVVKLKLPHYWKWFAIAAIIINFQESTFIRAQVASGVMFMVAYVALFADLYKKDRNIRMEEELMMYEESNLQNTGIKQE
jgi:exopolysaccharide production protein ExoQ